MTDNVDIRAVKEVVESWNTLKTAGRDFNQQDLRRFIETMNAHARKLITLYRETKPQYYQVLFELATLAQTMLSNVPYRVDDPLVKLARDLINQFGVNQSDFYTGLFELAQHAITMTTPGAKVFGDGVDRTNV